MELFPNIFKLCKEEKKTRKAKQNHLGAPLSKRLASLLQQLRRSALRQGREHHHHHPHHWQLLLLLQHRHLLQVLASGTARPTSSSCPSYRVLKFKHVNKSCYLNCNSRWNTKMQSRVLTQLVDNSGQDILQF